ncbi:MAG: hypothetical protein Q4Q23_02440 [Methanobacteriaceae archaeon]|nr:hypothetical protein [Methanobacteriaceae archaeon]
MNKKIKALQELAEKRDIPITPAIQKIIETTQNPEKIEQLVTSIKLITQELENKTPEEKKQYEQEYTKGPEEKKIFQLAKEAPLTEDEADDLIDLLYKITIINFAFCSKCNQRTYKKNTTLTWSVYQTICSSCQKQIIIEKVKRYPTLVEIIDAEECNCGVFKPVENANELHTSMGRILEDIVVE